MSEQKGDRVGTITPIFDHNQRGLVDELTDLEHEYSGLIKSSLHMHLDEDNRLEVILVRGESQDIRSIVEKMMALKGVKQVKLTTTSPGEGL